MAPANSSASTTDTAHPTIDGRHPEVIAKERAGISIFEDDPSESNRPRISIFDVDPDEIEYAQALTVISPQEEIELLAKLTSMTPLQLLTAAAAREIDTNILRRAIVEKFTPLYGRPQLPHNSDTDFFYSSLDIMAWYMHRIIDDQPFRAQMQAELQNNPGYKDTPEHAALAERIKDATIVRGWFPGNPWFVEMPIGFYPFYPAENKDNIPAAEWAQKEAQRRAKMDGERRQLWKSIRKAAVGTLTADEILKTIPLLGEMAAQTDVELFNIQNQQAQLAKETKSLWSGVKSLFKSAISFLSGDYGLGDVLRDVFISKRGNADVALNNLKTREQKARNHFRSLYKTANLCMAEAVLGHRPEFQGSEFSENNPALSLPSIDEERLANTEIGANPSDVVWLSERTINGTKFVAGIIRNTSPDWQSIRAYHESAVKSNSR